MAGDDRRLSQGGAASDAASINHVDNGHLRAFVPRPRGRRGRPTAANAGRRPTPPGALRATGTDDQTAKGALQLAQQLERETTQTAAKRCEEESHDNAQKKTPKTLVVADLDDDVRPDAKHSESAPSRTRTLNLLIKSQLLCQLS